MKIIQILIAPNDGRWSGQILGLGDDGNLYWLEHDGWTKVVIY